MADPSALNRRDFLEASLATGAAAAGLATLPDDSPAADDAPLQLHVYPGVMSCAAGEEMPLCISTSADRCSIVINRVGVDDKLVWSRDDLPGQLHPIPTNASSHGCWWPAAVRVPTTAAWRSGVYRVEVRARRGSAQASAETFFIVRSALPGKQARILFQLSTNTYQAYNDWGGGSLYSGPTHPRISFDRPVVITPAPTGPKPGGYNPNPGCYHTWDEPFILWAEQSGYELDYCANLDLGLVPNLLDHYRLVLSVGHDEYWSAGMRDKLEAYIAAGGNVAFLSGNSICWQVRVEDQGRALVCHKRHHDRDPIFAGPEKKNLTTLWSDPLVQRPENQLSGVGFLFGGYNGFFGEFATGPGAGEYVVHQPNHWLFAGTGLQLGETFGRLKNDGPQPGIAGYECDGCEFIVRNGLPVPTGRDGTPAGFQILATAPARWSQKDNTIDWVREIRKSLPRAAEITAEADFETHSGAAVMGIYQRGGTVVTVGSCGWSYGLQARDHVVDRIVRNLLDRLSV